MANGDMVHDLEFEQQIHAFSESEKFLARQMYAINQRCGPCLTNVAKHERDMPDIAKRLKAIEDEHKERVKLSPSCNVDRRQIAAPAAAGGLGGALIMWGAQAVMKYFGVL